MQIRVLYFAGLRESLGLAEETLVLPETVEDVAGLKQYLIEQGRTPLAQAKNLRVAINQEMARPGSRLQAGMKSPFSRR